MSIVRSLRKYGRLVVLILVVSLGACSSTQPPANYYQSETGTTQPEAEPVTALQKQAIAALEDEQYQQAIEYLQRAIKIQPRNAWSWHYLAKSYWYQDQYERCLEMIDRSGSYAEDDAVTDANNELKARCQQG